MRQVGECHSPCTRLSQRRSSIDSFAWKLPDSSGLDGGPEIPFEGELLVDHGDVLAEQAVSIGLETFYLITPYQNTDLPGVAEEGVVEEEDITVERHIRL